MTSRRLFAITLTGSLLGALGAACTDEEPLNNGVNDVKAACELRVGWTKADSTACVECIAVSKAPKCECPAYQQGYAAKCNVQLTARAEEPTCEETYGCVGACDEKDCACVDACFAGKERCRELTSAVDGCTTDVCDAYCR